MLFEIFGVKHSSVININEIMFKDANISVTATTTYEIHQEEVKYWSAIE